jgi:glutathione synthase/RimK-type ligase-like ATP-grasp enzyme
LPLSALRRETQSEPHAPAFTAGLAGFARTIFAGGDIQPTWDRLMSRAAAAPADLGAMLDLSTILQLIGEREQGLALQADALRRQRHYRRVVGTGCGPRLLALVAPGDLMASTPVEFLLGGWNGTLDLLFVAAGDPPLARTPEHDVAILAVGESDANASILAALAPQVAAWPKPMLNASVDAIAALGRDRAPRRLARSSKINAPPTRRVGRHALATLQTPFPIIVRPIDSHAGVGLSRLERRRDLAAYLAERDEPSFYVSPFVDYASADGRYRKLRVALIEGRPFIAHMAISEHWMVHYLNAGMSGDEAKRAEEARMMAAFDASFATRHAAAFATLHAAFGLDYFAVDCAEDRDGRLLLFEADTAMIVHDMDPPALYPYKRPAMERLFTAFQAMVAARAA